MGRTLLGEFQNGQCTTGPQNPPHFYETCTVVCKVAVAEGDGDEVEARVPEGECEAVAFEESGAQARTIEFLAGTLQHGVAEVAANESSAGFAFESDEKVTGTAGEIEDAGVGATEDVTDPADGDIAPVLVDICREQVIGEVVARSYAAKHGADPARGFALGSRAVRGGSGD